MRNICLAFVVSLTTLTGCKDITAHISEFISPEPPSAEEAFRHKIKEDLKAFNRIASFGSQTFFELESPLRKAANKSQSTEQIRSELVSFANELNSQNEKFKVHHFRTNEGAKLRNKFMQLNYATIQIIQVIDNPVVVQRRLDSYLQRQRKLINEYESIKADMNSKI